MPSSHAKQQVLSDHRPHRNIEMLEKIGFDWNPRRLSRLGDASSSGALGGDGSGAASGDEDGTMEDWMFDIESVDAAIAAIRTAGGRGARWRRSAAAANLCTF